MPDLSDKQTISKDYLVDVINTVYPNSMKKLCKALKDKKKHKRQVKRKNYVKVLPRYEAFLMSFESKKQEEALPRSKFAGKLLESRKKGKERRKERISVDISSILDSLLQD